MSRMLERFLPRINLVEAVKQSNASCCGGKSYQAKLFSDMQDLGHGPNFVDIKRELLPLVLQLPVCRAEQERKLQPAP